jgi:hypothetical protein
MLAYPGYTVDSVDRELTPRKIESLMRSCVKDPPAAMQLAKLNAILCGLLGIKDERPEVETVAKDAELKEKLMALSGVVTVSRE